MFVRHGVLVLTMLAISVSAFDARRVLAADEPAVADLIKDLSSSDAEVREAATEGLGAMGPLASSAVEPLVKALSDKEADVRSHAAWALGRIGEPAKKAAPELAKAVVDQDADVRRAALNALRAIKPDREVTLPIISQALENADPALRLRVLHTMADFGEAAIPALNKAMEHPEAKYWAVLVLGEIGPKAKDAVPGLTKLLTDKSAEVRREAAMALGAIGESSKPAIPALVKALDDESTGVRFGASFALGSLGAEAKAAVPSLTKGLESKNEFTRVVSAWALAKIQAKDPKALANAVDVLAKAVASKDAGVRRAAIRGLADLKPGPEKMLPALKAAFDNASETVVTETLEAVAAQGEGGIPILVAALKRPEYRGQAAMLLGHVENPGSEAVTALNEALEDKNDEVRREVIFSLAHIGPIAAPAAPKLAKLLDDESPQIRHSAAYALGRIGPEAKAAVPALQKTLKSDDTFERGVSAWALAYITPDDAATAKEIAPVLIKGLENDQAMVRHACASALGQLGKKAAGAADALQAATKDSDETVRDAAADSLKKIKG